MLLNKTMESSGSSAARNNFLIWGVLISLSSPSPGKVQRLYQREPANFFEKLASADRNSTTSRGITEMS
jgi:hypothetical protein